MENKGKSGTVRLNSVEMLRTELARKIAFLTSATEPRVVIEPGILLARQVAPSAPCMNTYEPSVIIVAQGAKRVDLGNREFVYDRSRYLLTAIDLPLMSQVVEASEAVPMLAMKMKLDMYVVRELLSREEVHVNAVAGEGAGLVTGEITPELLGAFIRLLDLVETPHHMPFLSGLIQREVIYRILSGPEGARLRAIATLGDQSQRTAKAIVWIKDNFAKQLRVDELAEMAGMGVSTFHHHFRALTHMSPVQYQKQLRLQAARGRLLVGDVDATTAAYGVGYESVSQFNREYARYFGRPPVRDVKSLLGSDADELIEA